MTTALIVSVIILSKPILNGLGIQATETILAAKIAINFSDLRPVCVLLLTCAYGYYQ